MKRFVTIYVFLFFVSFISANHIISEKAEETFTIYLIRHSEKDLFSENQFDPPLTACGIKRSEYLNSFFEDIDFEKVYSTNYLRTKNTAAPIALSKQLKIEYYDSFELKDFSELLIDSKQNSLIVGHSNTVPVLAGLLVDEPMSPFDESTYNRIYKVVINEGRKKLFVLKTTFNCN